VIANLPLLSVTVPRIVPLIETLTPGSGSLDSTSTTDPWIVAGFILVWAQLKEAGIDKIHFAYAGSTQSGEPYTYRVQGPTFVVEFLNVQPDSAGNKANHIHSAWRNIKGDFGLPAE